METFSALLALCAGNSRHRWIPHTKASDAELWCFLWSAPEQTIKTTIVTPIIWDAVMLIMTPWHEVNVISGGTAFRLALNLPGIRNSYSEIVVLFWNRNARQNYRTLVKQACSIHRAFQAGLRKIDIWEHNLWSRRETLCLLKFHLNDFSKSNNVGLLNNLKQRKSLQWKQAIIYLYFNEWQLIYFHWPYSVMTWPCFSHHVRH